VGDGPRKFNMQDALLWVAGLKHRRHFVPSWFKSDPALASSINFRLRTGLVYPFLRQGLDAALLAHRRKPSDQTMSRLVRWHNWIGAWSTTPPNVAEQMHAIDFRALPEQRPTDQRYIVPGKTRYFYPLQVPEAIHLVSKGMRILAVPAGGVGDLIIFAQLFRQMRACHGVQVDIGYEGTAYPERLLSRLFHPAKVLPFPMGEKEFRRYNAVMPIGMHKVVHGETMPAYFERAYSTAFTTSGFDVDEATESDVRRRLTLRHGIDPKSHRVIFIHAACRPNKNYPHFDALAERLVTSGHKVVVIGAFADSAINDQPGKLANLCGLPIWETIVALRDAALFIGPDSCFLHAAAAWDVPSLVLFGPTPLYWASAYPKTTGVIFSNTCRFHPCWMTLDAVPPCGIARNPPCLEQISVDYLERLVAAKLAGKLTGAVHDVRAFPRTQVTTSRV
jgi:ADP-heptose:LPS heptosyltransferase